MKYLEYLLYPQVWKLEVLRYCIYKYLLQEERLFVDPIDKNNTASLYYP